MEINRTATSAERLREAMQAAGKKQADLARETGLDKGSISSYLSGKYEPKQKAVGLLAKALDVSEMWLWGYDVPKTHTPDQKKNNHLVQVIAKLRTDSDFYELVSMLAELPTEQRESIKPLVSALIKK